MKIFRYFFYLGLWIGLTILFFTLVLFVRLPEIEELRDVSYRQPLQILTSEGNLIARIGSIKRDPIAFEDIPQPLIYALISAEDARFFQHIGLDYRGLARATLQFITRSDVQTGGSTITMQVARNYYLTRERTILRKMNEILLALKIEQMLTKEEIMALYVNKIFLGFQSYGMAAAAETYYNKPLRDLSLAQYAMLAALPKAPSKLNPISNPDLAKERRNWILARMTDLGYISRGQYLSATKEALSAAPYDYRTEVEANYLAETVRLNLIEEPERYNITKEELYTKGYQVFTTINKDMQQYANEAVRLGLLEYDRRHGWRGAERKFDSLSSAADFDETNPLYKDALSELAKISSYDSSLEPAIVRQLEEKNMIVVTSKGENINISWEGLEWAAAYISDEEVGETPRAANEIADVGDMVRITPNGKSFLIAQVPKAEGAFVALDPRSGKTLALVGGYHFQKTKFNRAIQAQRQIGSAIKPFIYTHAFHQNLTGADILKDAPLVTSTQSNFIWRPTNVGNRFLGYIPLRVGLYRSRNLVSVRLLRQIGIEDTRDYISKFGIRKDSIPKDLSLALGSGSASPLEMARAYSVFANGGFLIKPYYIDSILDANGNPIYQSLPQLTEANYSCCLNKAEVLATTSQEKPPRILDEALHYQVHSILKDVVQRGTAVRAKALGRSDLGGKTGTTQQFADAWFAGYNPYITAVSWVGFDKPSSLGPREYGGVAALPIWISFMDKALKGVPEVDFGQPEELITINITTDYDNQFSEFIPQEHLKDFLARASRNTALVDYTYSTALDKNGDSLDFSLNTTSIQKKREATKELF